MSRDFIRDIIGKVKAMGLASTICRKKATIGLLVWQALWITACVFSPTVSESRGSVGTASNGVLMHGEALPTQGQGFVRARPGDMTRWGTPQLVGALQRAAASVAQHFAPAAPLRIGDLSSEMGGAHPRHGSHRSGRDADVMFYLTDAQGVSVRGMGWLAINRYGYAKENTKPGGSKGSGNLFFFDEARNWHFVRTLLLDPSIDVQWIFCSNGIKNRLLNYAAIHEPRADVLVQATWVLHRPSQARAHDDHFHVRVMCSAEERLSGCIDQAPLWPWWRRKPDAWNWRAEAILGDTELIQELMQASQ